MMPHASKYGLRLITMNMRDYRGSTPHTDKEVAEFGSPDVEVQTYAVRKFGRVFGDFVLWQQ